MGAKNLRVNLRQTGKRPKSFLGAGKVELYESVRGWVKPRFGYDVEWIAANNPTLQKMLKAEAMAIAKSASADLEMNHRDTGESWVEYEKGVSTDHYARLRDPKGASEALYIEGRTGVLRRAAGFAVSKRWRKPGGRRRSVYQSSRRGVWPGGRKRRRR